MFIDASAIIALLAQEPEAERLAERIEAAPARWISPVVMVEAVMVLSTMLSVDPSVALDRLKILLTDAEIGIIPIDAKMGEIATEAFARFGKGRHPARLNFGDCLSYAGAKTLGVPLLFKGDDFSKTDISSALA